MAKVTFSAGIDHVSGALAKPGSNPQHSCEKMLLATHRVAETTCPDCNRLYLRKKVVRKSPLSAAEMVNRERFGAVTRAVNTRMHDISKISQDQAAFKAQTTYKTMKSYLWALCAQAYDESQG